MVTLVTRAVAILGPLRLALLLLAIASVLSAPFAGGEVAYTFPEVIPTLVAPPFAVMLAFILPLDMIMTGVFLSGAADAEKPRFRKVLLIELVGWLVLCTVWSPYFSNLATR